MGQVLSAFRAGYLCRQVRHHLRSLWSEDLRRVMDVDPVMAELDSALIALSSLVNNYQATTFSAVRDRIFDLEETVKLEGGDHYFERSPDVLHLRTLRAEDQSVARYVQGLQENACDDLHALLSAVVSGDKRLAGWYELGDHLADLTYRLMTGRQGLPLTERDFRCLNDGLAKLPKWEVSAVRIFFPFRQKETASRMALDLLSTYGGLCEALEDEERWNRRAGDKRGEQEQPVTPVQSAGLVASQTGPLPPAPSVVLSGQGKPPIVLGKTKPVLTHAQYEVVEALVQAGSGGLSLDDLVLKSRHTDARKILKRVAAGDEDWEAVIQFPGKAHGRYQIG